MKKQFHVTMLLHVFFGLVFTFSKIPSIVEMTAGNSHMLPHEQVLHLPRESCTFFLDTFFNALPAHCATLVVHLGVACFLPFLLLLARFISSKLQ